MTALRLFSEGALHGWTLGSENFDVSKKQAESLDGTKQTLTTGTQITRVALPTDALENVPQPMPRRRVSGPSATVVGVQESSSSFEKELDNVSGLMPLLGRARELSSSEEEFGNISVLMPLLEGALKISNRSFSANQVEGGPIVLGVRESVAAAQATDKTCASVLVRRYMFLEARVTPRLIFSQIRDVLEWLGICIPRSPGLAWYSCHIVFEGSREQTRVPYLVLGISNIRLSKLRMR